MPIMTVKQFYVGLGSVGDWACRAKIERAVFNFKISWRDTLTDQVCQIIANS